MSWTTRGMLAAALVALIGVGCTFFPETGNPVGVRLDSPLAVIDQLLASYENLRPDAFRELLIDDGSYRFFVSPVLSADDLAVQTQDTLLDGTFEYVAAGRYRYWTYDQEVIGHDKLLNSTTTVWLLFTVRPSYAEDDVVYHTNTSGDTVCAEVLMLGGQMELRWVDPDNSSQNFISTAEIERQVFVVTSVDGQWKIKYWFDFGTTPG